MSWFRARKSPTYAPRSPKNFSITPEQVMLLVSLVPWVPKYVYEDDPKVSALVAECEDVLNKHNNGHRVELDLILADWMPKANDEQVG